MSKDSKQIDEIAWETNDLVCMSKPNPKDAISQVAILGSSSQEEKAQKDDIHHNQMTVLHHQTQQYRFDDW